MVAKAILQQCDSTKGRYSIGWPPCQHQQGMSRQRVHQKCINCRAKQWEKWTRRLRKFCASKLIQDNHLLKDIRQLKWKMGLLLKWSHPWLLNMRFNLANFNIIILLVYFLFPLRLSSEGCMFIMCILF